MPAYPRPLAVVDLGKLYQMNQSYRAILCIPMSFFKHADVSHHCGHSQAQRFIRPLHASDQSEASSLRL